MHEFFWLLTGAAIPLGCLLALLVRHRRCRPQIPPDHTRRRGRRRQLPTRRLELGDARPLEELSHSLGGDLASLATGVEGHAQLLCEALDRPVDAAEHAAELWEAVRRLRFFSEKMQSLAAIPQLLMRPTDVRQLLGALAQEIEDYSNGHLQVAVDLAPSLPLARAHAATLRKALLFLVEGVIDLEPQASTLFLQAQADEGSEHELLVRIDIEAVLDEEVDPPCRPRAKMQFSYLAARQLLHAQNAHFSMDHCPGVSALASVSLLATEHAAAAAGAEDGVGEGSAGVLPSPPTATPHQFGGVLIMEGNGNIRDMLTRELGRSCRHVINAADGVAARSLFEQTPERFEILIAELEGRRMRGDALAIAALRHNSDLRILLLAPGPGAVIAAELEGRKNVFVLCKPFGIMELREALTSCLGIAPRRELAEEEGGDEAATVPQAGGGARSPIR